MLWGGDNVIFTPRLFYDTDRLLPDPEVYRVVRFFEELVILWRKFPFREGTANVNCFIGTEVVFNFSTLWDMNKVWMTLAWQSRAFSFNNTWY